MIRARELERAAKPAAVAVVVAVIAAVVAVVAAITAAIVAVDASHKLGVKNKALKCRDVVLQSLASSSGCTTPESQWLRRDL